MYYSYWVAAVIKGMFHPLHFEQRSSDTDTEMINFFSSDKANLY